MRHRTSERGGTRLEYVAAHADAILRLSVSDRSRWTIEGLLCDVSPSPTELFVNVSEGAADLERAVVPGTTVLLGRCGDSFASDASFASLVLSSSSSSSSRLRLTLRDATVEEIFRDANVTLTVPSNAHRRRSLPSSGDCPTDACAACLRGGGGSSCGASCADCGTTCTDCVSNGGGSACQSRCSTSSCTDACSSCVSNGGGTGCATRCSACGDVCLTCIRYAGGKACAQRCRSSTGCDSNDVRSSDCNDDDVPQFSASKTFAWSASGRSLYDRTAGGAKVDVACATCDVSFAPGVELSFVISQSRLQSMRVALTGDFDATAELSLSATASAHVGPLETVLTTLRVPSITFFVGAFPVKLDLSLPIRVGYQLDASASASVKAGVRFSGDAELGVSYAGGDLRSDFSQSFAVSRRGPAYDGSASVTTSGWISATVEIELNNFVRAGVEMRPGVDVVGKLSSSGVSVVGKFDATVEGSLGLRLANVQIPPQASLPERNVYHYSKELWHSRR